MNKNLLYIIIFFVSFNSLSQNNEIGVFFGATNYIGDVGPTTYIDPLKYKSSVLKIWDLDKSTKTVFGILYRKNFTNRIAGRVQFNYAKIASNDLWPNSAAYRKQRGKSFENQISAEFGLGIDFNFFEFDLKEDSFQMTPYIHSGIAFLRYDALHYKNGVNEATKYDEDFTFSIPITIGYKIKPLRDFVVGFEISAKHTFTDNLDGSYPHDGDFIKENFGSNLSQDWYVFTGFILTYIFGFEPCYCPN